MREEGNKLIAEYVQIKYKEIIYKTGSSGDKYYHINDIPMLNDSCHCYPAYENDYQFHKSWDWLMPVVEKIENQGLDVIINTKTCVINDVGEDRFEPFESYSTGAKIDATYYAVIEYIKWYNKQQK